MDYKLKYSEILDFNVNKKENKVIFSCEHSSNSLDNCHLKWDKSDELNFKNKHWGLDIGALDLAIKLSKKFETNLLYQKCSRLILDPNRAPSHRTVFVTNGDGNVVEMNKDLTIEEKDFRLKNYWLSYAMGLRMISIKNENAKYAFSIHSFNPLFNKKIRDVEIGILTSYEEDSNIVKLFYNNFKKEGFNIKINCPYNAKLGTNYALNNLLNSHGYRNRDGLLFEVRNDLLLEEDKFNKIYEILSDSISELIK